MNLQDWIERIAVYNWIFFQRSATLFCVVTTQRHQRTFLQHSHTRFLFNQTTFLQLLQVRPVPKSKLLGIAVALLLQARHTSGRPTNSVKALKDDITDMLR